MDRRRFLALSGLLAVAARAQDGKVRRVGFLGVTRDMGFTDPAVARLRELGFSEGRNLVIEYAYEAGQAQKMQPFADALVKKRVEVIVAWGILPIIAARNATRSIPIVMVYGGDPVGLGFVRSLARPGGNITGLGWGDDIAFVDKLVELVRDAMPKAKAIGVLWNAADEGHDLYRRRIEVAAKKIGLRTISEGLRKPDDIAHAFERLKTGRVEAAVVSLDAFVIEQRALVEEQAARHRIPLIIPGWFGFKSAIINFGPDIGDQPRRAGEYAARILEGANPAEVPVEMSQKYELAVNVRQAAALGIAIPEAVLFRADRVIR